MRQQTMLAAKPKHQLKYKPHNVLPCERAGNNLQGKEKDKN